MWSGKALGGPQTCKDRQELKRIYVACISPGMWESLQVKVLLGEEGQSPRGLRDGEHTVKGCGECMSWKDSRLSGRIPVKSGLQDLSRN